MPLQSQYTSVSPLALDGPFLIFTADDSLLVYDAYNLAQVSSTPLVDPTPYNPGYAPMIFKGAILLVGESQCLTSFDARSAGSPNTALDMTFSVCTGSPSPPLVAPWGLIISAGNSGVSYLDWDGNILQQLVATPAGNPLVDCFIANTFKGVFVFVNCNGQFFVLDALRMEIVLTGSPLPSTPTMVVDATIGPHSGDGPAGLSYLVFLQSNGLVIRGKLSQPLLPTPLPAPAPLPGAPPLTLAPGTLGRSIAIGFGATAAFVLVGAVCVFFVYRRWRSRREAGVPVGPTTTESSPLVRNTVQ